MAHSIVLPTYQCMWAIIGKQHVHQQQSRMSSRNTPGTIPMYIDVHTNKQAGGGNHKRSSKKGKGKRKAWQKQARGATLIGGKYKRNMQIASQENQIKNLHNCYEQETYVDGCSTIMFVYVCGIEWLFVVLCGCPYALYVMKWVFTLLVLSVYDI